MRHYLRLGVLCLMTGVLTISCRQKENTKKTDDSDNDLVGVENYTEEIADANFSMDMIGVEGGTFDMGATAEHKVTLSSFYISRYEITQAQWKAVMGTTIEQQRDKENMSWDLYGVGDDYPMYYVSWGEAKEFCDKLSQKTGKKYALPTEAQWEFAARGGVKSNGYKYSGSNSINDVAWYAGNSYSLGSSHPDYGTHAVGTKAANELDIHDMSGNVWEWCADPVLRGGCWSLEATFCRVSVRYGIFSDSRSRGAGFRVVCLP